ncbi:MAG: rhodanese-like domain-containing protein, partial [Pseudomonadota bacterium]
MRKTLFAAVAAAALLAPPAALAEGYANPHLLMTVERLAPQMEVITEIGERTFELDGMVLIDVRPQAAYEAGHVPGARRIDPDAVADPYAPVGGALRPVEELAAMIGALGISADTEVVFYDDKGGFHAARMFWL